MNFLTKARFRSREDEDHTPEVEYCCETCGDKDPVHDKKNNEYICRDCIEKKINKLCDEITNLENL